MNKLVVSLLASGLFAASIFAEEQKKNYWKSLPEDSLIRKECETCKSMWPSFLKSKKEKQCEFIRHYMERVDIEPDRPSDYRIVNIVRLVIQLANEEKFARAKIDLLAEEDDEVQLAEYRKIEDALEKIK